MRAFTEPLTQLQGYEELEQAVQKTEGVILVSGCIDAVKPHIVYSVHNGSGNRIIVTFHEQKAKELLEEYRFFDKNVAYYPAKDILFYQSDIRGNVLTSERINALKMMAEEKECTIITTFDGLMNPMPAPEKFIQAVKKISVGDTVELNGLTRHLVELGYEKNYQAETMGEFSVRGGIIDIFPLTEETPFRIELWGDEVDSIRSFDPESQRSVEQLEEVVLYPATEIVLTPEQVEMGLERITKSEKSYEKTLREQFQTEEAHRIRSIIEEFKENLKDGMAAGSLDSYLTYFCQDTVSFAEYFPAEETAVFLDEPIRLKERGEAVETEFRESMMNRLEKGYLLPEQTSLLYSIRETLAELETPHTVCVTGLEQKLPGQEIKNRYSIQTRNINSYQNSFDMLISDLTRWKKESYRVVLLSASRTRASRLASDLREYDLRAYCPDGTGEEHKAAPGEILVTYGNIHRGFEYPLIKYVIITEGDMFGTEKKKKRRKKSNYQGKAIQSFSELAVGDYVVHEEHGLGIYKGIEKVERDKVIKDYIKIEYGDGGNLYLPATRLESIQKYAGADAKKPKLNKLGGTEWNKTKTRVKGAVQEIARDLVKLYAARQAQKGYQYGEDTVWQKEFEELFPYEETDDQLDAIEAVKKDMESRKIMDRLICGDVGYGKTEIALRAAFKAVQDSKQVVYLVPTTILAQQHYNTFVQRMKDFPVRIDMLSRFCTPSQQKKTLEDLRKGMVDIVIGTHRVLSKDLKFKNLGLLIIDEEQRFGVAHKEKIKQLKENVDVMTLTATPIPRTLHMSLAGIRDMSVLEEPPVDRTPIQTYVMEYNEEMVREAINRELARKGQVYYVYNRVTDIDEVAAKIQKLVPDAVVTFAHGQMHEHQLERIMTDFINGEIDVLVSTTIIETGLDIPNANTMIIHDADRLGLSQLYQLRGRVGRSNRTSFAFLMYKRDKLLKEEAEKRLQAIREFTELGSGIKIAMRDLEIRGAGNVLGAEQHGHMEAVGYDLYCKMLNQAVLALKGEETEEESYATSVECDIDAYIPAAYIKNEYQKLDIYKRISAIETEDEYMDMQDELMDRFGDIPKSVENLLVIARVRALAHKCYVTEVLVKEKEVKLTMYQKAKINVGGIPDLVNSYGGALKLVPGEVPVFHYVERKPKGITIEDMLFKAEEILKGLRKLRM